MIEITFTPSIYELKISGHAEHGKKGEDIVCSAVSILFYTLAQSLTLSSEMLSESPIITEKDGNGCISCKPKEEYEANVSLIYWTLLNGIELIAENYKKNIRFSVKK